MSIYNSSMYGKLNLSVIAPSYNEQDVLPAFFARVSAACKLAVGESYELIIVDDGSSDNTWQVISEMQSQFSCLHAIRLSRNYGHQLAITAGLDRASGERILIIDADLQDPPELLLEMMSEMDNGADVVYGQRRSRRGVSRIKRACYKAFYRVLSVLAGCHIPPDTGDFRLITKSVAEVLRQMPEHHRFLRGMISWIGLTQRSLLYDRDPRFAGKSQYSWAKLFRLALDGITSFSIKPLRLAALLAVIVGMTAIAGLIFIIIGWWLKRPVQGWASLAVTILFLGSMQLLVLGIIGEYLGVLFVESKRRPLYVVAELLGPRRSAAGADG